MLPKNPWWWSCHLYLVGSSQLCFHPHRLMWWREAFYPEQKQNWIWLQEKWRRKKNVFFIKRICSCVCKSITKFFSSWGVIVTVSKVLLHAELVSASARIQADSEINSEWLFNCEPFETASMTDIRESKFSFILYLLHHVPQTRDHLHLHLHFHFHFRSVRNTLRRFANWSSCISARLFYWRCEHTAV